MFSADEFHTNIFIKDVPNSSRTLALLQYYLNHNENLIYVVNTNDEIDHCYSSIKFINKSIKIVKLFEWDCPHYDNFGPSRSIKASRINNIIKLKRYIKNNSKFILITTINCLLQRFQDIDAYSERRIETNMDLIYSDFINYIENTGYEKVDNVIEVGTYANRGGIIDIFSSNYNYPIRLDFFGDNIETIRYFDYQSQKTIKSVNSISLFPFSEIYLFEDNINNFRRSYIHNFKRKEKDYIYESITSGQRINGLEQYLPLFFDKLKTLDLAIPNARVVISETSRFEADIAVQNINELYTYKSSLKENDDFVKDMIKPLIPNELFVNEVELNRIFKNKTLVISSAQNPNIQNIEHYQYFDVDIRLIDKNNLKNNLDIQQRQENIISIINKFYMKYYIVVTAQNTKNAALYLKGIVPQFSKIKVIDNLDEVVEISSIYVTNKIDTGNILTKNYLYLSYDKTFNIKNSIKSQNHKKSVNYLKEITSLNVGDFIVHRDYGIGKFESLKKITTNSVTYDCLELKYRNEDKVHLPVENIDLLSLYSHSNNDNIELDKLGAANWQYRKAQAKDRIKEIAFELINIEAKRKTSIAPKIIQDNKYNEFISYFPYSETNDQEKAEKDILEDLKKGIPMDRLICGDVGFGKTELALRSTFLLVSSGYQVIILVPTTLLAKQHYENFNDRFQKFSVNIECLSRLTTRKKRAEILENLQIGKIDIIIGTHALLNDDLTFKNLGLIIIDEEQSFGVKQKEFLKKHSYSSHILSLSATPIPRSLQLSLNGIRDMSLIFSPPEGRLPIKTFVNYFEPSLIRGAILNEKERNGQSFIICPKIKDIPKIEDFVKKNIPEVKYAIAHGKLKNSEITKIIDDFYENKYDLIIATSIVQSGLDIPNANTIVITNAHNFGLSQIYQIRGRVGRSKMQSSAYITLPRRNMSKNALARLQILQNLDSLGMGFVLASHDLDIRGAGNLLGSKQSGHIKDVGIELFNAMLEDEINILRNKAPEVNDWSPVIKTNNSYYIPEEYINDIKVRMGIYRRLSEAKTQEDLDILNDELLDRFGMLPDEVKELLAILKLKIKCKNLNISKLEFSDHGVNISFNEKYFYNHDNLFTWIESNKNIAQIKRNNLLFLKNLNKVSLNSLEVIKTIDLLGNVITHH
ncbi:transcription-repair coupling factor [Gammaproteobacteria bacterium]|nr:transcription-repair coupling factor [Gammaproteobacteria bacterium]